MTCTENPLYETLFDANCPDIRFGDISYLVIIGRDSIEPDNPSDPLEWSLIQNKAILRGKGQMPEGEVIEVETYSDDSAMLRMEREIEFVISDLNNVNYRFLQQFCAVKNVKVYFGNDEDLYKVGNARITNADIYSAGDFMEGKITIKYSINCSESILHDRYKNILADIADLTEWTTNVLNYANQNSIPLPADFRDIKKLNSFLTDLGEEFVEDYRPNFLFYGEYISATPEFRLINLAEHTIYSTATSYPKATAVGGLTYEALGFKGNGVDAYISTDYSPTKDYGAGWNKLSTNIGQGLMVNEFSTPVSASSVFFLQIGGSSGSRVFLVQFQNDPQRIGARIFGGVMNLYGIDNQLPNLLLLQNTPTLSSFISNSSTITSPDPILDIAEGDLVLFTGGNLNDFWGGVLGVTFNYLTTTNFDYNKMKDAILNARNI